MPATKRTILKPQDLDGERMRTLRDALASAAERQAQLAARSTRILTLDPTLKEDDRAFWFTHAPIEPLTPTAPLYEPAIAPREPHELVNVLHAAADALAAAHASQSGAPTVHGGVCPAVFVRDADGRLVLTDFGVAPAVCAALGPDAYIHLACDYRDDAAVWEVCDATADRDDRLCAFVDPEKFSSGALASFEPGSDLIALGMVMFLLAEHRHPYLYVMPGAHRLVDTAEMMSYELPAQLERSDLLEAEEPATQVLCGLLEGLLARSPADRLSATKVIAALSPFVDDAAETAGISWRRWIDGVSQALAAEDTTATAKRLDARPTDPFPSPQTASRVDELVKRAEALIAAEAKRAELEATYDDSRRWLKRLSDAIDRADAEAALSLHAAAPPADAQPADVVAALPPLLAQVQAFQFRREVEAWGAELRRALDAKQWKQVQRLLQRTPMGAGTMPDEVAALVDEARAAYDEHRRALEAQRAERERQHAVVERWLVEARSIAQEARWNALFTHLEQPPEVEHWPENGAAEAAELRERAHNGIATRLDDKLNEYAAQVQATLAAALEPALLEVEPFVPSTALSVGVGAFVWGPESSDSDGRTEVTLTVAGPAASSSQSVVLGSAEFRATDDGLELTRDPATLAEVARRELPTLIANLQQAALDALVEPWRRSVFRGLTAQAELEQPTRETVARMTLLSEAVGEDAHDDLSLTWDADRLAWRVAELQQFFAFARDLAVRRAAERAREAIATQLSRVGELAGALRVVFTPAATSNNELPQSLSGPAEVSLASVHADQSLPLIDAEVTCDALDDVAVRFDVSRATSQANKSVLQAQESFRRGLTENINAWLGEHGACTAAPAKPIRSPIDALSFTVEAGGDPWTFAAPWSSEKLAFLLPTEAIDRLTKVAGSPASDPQRVVLEASAAPKAASGKWLIGAGAGALLLGAAAAAFVWSPASSPPTPEPPTPMPPPICEIDAARLREEGLQRLSSGAPNVVSPASAQQRLTRLVTPELVAEQGDLLQGATLELAEADPDAQVLTFQLVSRGPNGSDAAATLQYIRDCDPQSGEVTWRAGPDNTAAFMDLIAATTPQSTPCELEPAPLLAEGRAVLGRPDEPDRVEPSEEQLGLLVNTEIVGERAQQLGLADLRLSAGAVADEQQALRFALSRLVAGNPIGAETLIFQRTCDPQTGAAQWRANPVNVERFERVATISFRSEGVAALQDQVVALDRENLPPLIKQLLVLTERDALPAALDPNAVAISLAPPPAEANGPDLPFVVTVAMRGSDWTGERRLLWRHAIVPNQGSVWSSDANNEVALAELASAVERGIDAREQAARLARLEQLQTDLAAAVQQGALATVHQIAAEMQQLNADPNLPMTIPPPWADDLPWLNGFTAEGETDASTGYPVRLRRGDQRWTLVHAPPQDQTVRSVAAAITPDDLNRPWRLLYVAEQPLDAPSYESATRIAREAGARLPTREEWLLAALTIRQSRKDDWRNSNWLGGKFEWVDGPDSPNGTHWVCGGATVQIAGRDVGLPPLPPTNANDEQWLAWLTNPLVMQQRQDNADHNEGLTAVRPVVAPGPSSP